ncbi:hypothetical protein [Candidatus Aquiluna sp. UB-MaderosW2red]|uniref:hypothetical protein n=1 Tax=Candidatus Aquiluna sp. UB-MaderosW2red TaxID=1855377 RepID=UPI000875BC44|nr:hypothetical protein [Candidatus Aquiluna sp. UB-MaderosW2red]SCX03631.1 hypothetical protein SAMN05216534_0144 [Candidatus Aquiluna sp. UB-MaderosW2red]
MNNTSVARLDQATQIATFRANGTGVWTLVSSSWNDGDGNSGGYYAAFSNPKVRNQVLSQTGWDVTKTDGMPGFSQSFNNGKIQTVFEADPLGASFEPILIFQDFNDLAPGKYLVNQTFILVMELWEDPQNQNFFEIKPDGTRELAVEYSGDQIKIRTSILRRYQAARQLDLLLFADTICKVTNQTDVTTLRKLGYDEVSDVEAVHLAVGKLGTSENTAFSRLLMKRVIPPLLREVSGLWPWESGETFQEFIVGEDEVGNPLSSTCNPSVLADYFGSNEGAPNYMTSVFFKADVLMKYFESPSTFSVSSSYLKCAGLWGLRIDYHRPDQVVVALGDLGRDLPESERHHWRACNIVPSERSMSLEHFQSSVLGEWVETSSPTERFKAAYLRTNAAWEKRWGWPLFRTPTGDDQFLLKRLRVPLNETQVEFENQVLILAKLLVDHLNERQLGAGLDKIDDEKGIAKFERFATTLGHLASDQAAQLLRKIYKLRSKHTAHAGGDSGKRFKESLLEERTTVAFFSDLLEESVELLEQLTLEVTNQLGG